MIVFFFTVSWCECRSKLLTMTRVCIHIVLQAGDGQWVFINPLNLKCLIHHYGDYEACPPSITAPVLEVESVEQVLRWLGRVKLVYVKQFR